MDFFIISSFAQTGDSGTKELHFGAIDSQIRVIATHSGANRMLVYIK